VELQKINVKFFVAEPNHVPLTDFIDLFHGWIQATDGVYHDVADYSHMQTGPGIVLVAQDAHVSFDETGGRRGLLYTQKSRLEGTNQEKLRQVFRSALENCQRVEKEPVLMGKMKFQADETEIAINDRLIAPNTEQAFLELKADLETFLSKLYAGSAISMERNNDPRDCLGLRVKASRPFDIATLLKNVNQELTNNCSP
jgi:hypothetical protein